MSSKGRKKKENEAGMLTKEVLLNRFWGHDSGRVDDEGEVEAETYDGKRQSLKG